MRYFLTTIFLGLALLCWSASATAIKADKSESAQDKAETAEKPDQSKQSDQAAKPAATEQTPAKSEKPAATKESSGGLLDRLKREVQKAKSAPAPKYDQFQDANKDGVSDKARKSWTGESAKSKPSEKAVKPSQQTEKPKRTVKPTTPVKKTPATTKKPTTTKKKDP
jgi:hypothetical protein